MMGMSKQAMNDIGRRIFAENCLGQATGLLYIDPKRECLLPISWLCSMRNRPNLNSQQAKDISDTLRFECIIARAAIYDALWFTPTATWFWL